MKNRRKIISTAAAILAALLIPVGVYALKSGVLPTTSSGGFVRQTVDRINLSVDKTEFTFKKSEDGIYTIKFELSAEKTEAEFYGRLDSFSITGFDTQYTLLTSADGNAEYVLDSAVLPAKNGKAEKLVWQVEAPCRIGGAGTFNGEIKIEYTSGVTEQFSDSHILAVPVKITVK